MDDGRALSFRPGAWAGGSGSGEPAIRHRVRTPSNAASLVNSWLTPPMDSLQISRRRRLRTIAASRPSGSPANRGASPVGASGFVRPQAGEQPVSGDPRSRDGFRAIPLIWGMELLRLRRSLLFTRAISRPAVRVVFRLARGVRAGRLGQQFCQLTFRSAPVAISLVFSAPLSPQARPRGPARIPLRGAFCFERAHLCRAALRARGQAPISVRKRE